MAEQLAKLLEELKKEKDSFKGMGIDYEEKAFYDILKAVAKKYEFEYPDDKMIELSKRIKIIVDDKAKYTDWSTRDDIKANLQVDLILLLDEFDYPPVTIDDVYKEVLEQAEKLQKVRSITRVPSKGVDHGQFSHVEWRRICRRTDCLQRQHL